MLPTARNLWRKSCLRCCLRQEINHRNLDGIRRKIIIFNENPDWKCARIPRFWEGFYLWIAYGSTSKLESWTKSLTKMKSEVWGLKSEGVTFIILRKSFSVCSVCSVDKNFRAIRVRKFRNLKENVLESQETYRNVWLIFGDVVSLQQKQKRLAEAERISEAPRM